MTAERLKDRQTAIVTARPARRVGIPVEDPRSFRVSVFLTAAEREAFRFSAETLGISDSEAGEQAIRIWIDQLRADLAKDRSKRRKPSKPGSTDEKPGITTP